MSDHISSPLSNRLSSIKNRFSGKGRLVLKPSRLTLGAAAGTIAFAAVAGAAVSIGLSTGSGPSTADPAALNRARVVNAAHAQIHGSAAVKDGATNQHAAAPAIHAVPRHQAVPHHPAAAHQGAAKPRAVAHAVMHHTPAGPTKPYLIYDSVEPSAIPASSPAATYATGPFAVPASAVAGHNMVVWIDTNGSDPAASALDVEPGDATPSQAATWAMQRLSSRPNAVARIYTMISEWPSVRAAVAGLPQKIQSRVRWWIADPNGVPHIVPGSDATQWYWGQHYDISTATPRF